MVESSEISTGASFIVASDSVFTSDMFLVGFEYQASDTSTVKISVRKHYNL